MKDELTIRDIAMYLPYELQIMWNDTNDIYTIGFEGLTDFYKKIFPLETIIYCINRKPQDLGFKFLLRPLSDLTKEIEVNGERFVPIDWFEIGDEENIAWRHIEYTNGNINLMRSLRAIHRHQIHHDIQYLPFGVVKKLIEWKIDINNLIGRGLAEDLNTIEK